MKNTVELIGTYGDDLTHACSAWTSTGRSLSDDKKKRVGKMLETLAVNGHMTPFEKSSIHFLVTTDIATHIHLLKHRIGVSVNAESPRYKEIKTDKFIIPEDWPSKWATELKNYTREGLDLYHTCVSELQEYGLSRSRAKESARFFRTYNTQITSDVMFNWRSFAHFLKLRKSEHSQLEIRVLAEEMLSLISDTGLFPHTIHAMESANFIEKIN